MCHFEVQKWVCAKHVTAKSKRAKSLPFGLNLFCTCFAFDHVFTRYLTPQSGRNRSQNGDPGRSKMDHFGYPFWAPFLSPFSDPCGSSYLGPFCPRSVPRSTSMGLWIDTTCHHHAPMLSTCDYLIGTTKKGVRKSPILVVFRPLFSCLSSFAKTAKTVSCTKCYT